MASELVEAVRRYTEAQGGASPYVTAIPGLAVLRSDHEKTAGYLIFKPALCVVLQGAKWAIFGDRRLDYGPGQALIVSVEMPALGRVAQASPEEPYLGLILEFDLGVMRQVLDELEEAPQASARVTRGVFVRDFHGPLEDCALRLVRMLETPKAIPVLYPAVMREICYWLLTGPHGCEVMAMAMTHGHAQRVLGAIHHLRERFREAVRIGELAAMAQMSTSAFHREFKTMTGMTPLQYQKQLRLLEARRLMVAEAMNVETAAFQVGYESASQFSREYSRMFAASPRRDAAGVRRVAA
jgi:AraC-like DNA-binding protein